MGFFLSFEDFNNLNCLALIRLRGENKEYVISVGIQRTTREFWKENRKGKGERRSKGLNLINGGYSTLLLGSIVKNLNLKLTELGSERPSR